MILICIACGTSEINSYFAVNYAMREEDLLCAIIMFTKRVRDRSYLIWKLNTKFVSSIRNTWNALVPTSCFDCMKSKMSTVIMIVDWTSRKTSGYKYSRGCITRIPFFFVLQFLRNDEISAGPCQPKCGKLFFTKHRHFCASGTKELFAKSSRNVFLVVPAGGCSNLWESIVFHNEFFRLILQCEKKISFQSLFAASGPLYSILFGSPSLLLTKKNWLKLDVLNVRINKKSNTNNINEAKKPYPNSIC